MSSVPEAAHPQPVTVTYGVTSSVQQYLVTKTGTYSLTVQGASGGTTFYQGGFGAIITGNIYLVQGQVYNVVVGQAGADGGISDTGNAAAGGGGGSFVYRDNNDLLVAAGGGGGCGYGGAGSSGKDAQNSNSGTIGLGAGNTGYAGTSGGGGGTSTNYGGGGGAGFQSSGSSPTDNYSGRPGETRPSWAGGLASPMNSNYFSGGYGGGGAGGWRGGGGGGGYSGGGGGSKTTTSAGTTGSGGGGGSGGSYLVSTYNGYSPSNSGFALAQRPSGADDVDGAVTIAYAGEGTP